MADNIDVTPGSGATVAADLISSALHQRIKISLGADGSATDALGGAGVLGNGVQRVTIATDDPVGQGATTTARLASAAASTNALNVKASAARVYAISGKNAAAYDVFLVLYDATTSPPVPGTTTIRSKIPLPAGAVFQLDFPRGLSFATGLGYAITKLAADADTTAIAAADVLQLNIHYT